jgi:hypothetical protein
MYQFKPVKLVYRFNRPIFNNPYVVRFSDWFTGLIPYISKLVPVVIKYCNT